MVATETDIDTEGLFTMDAFEKSNNMENLWPFKNGFTENEVTVSLARILYSYDIPLKRTKRFIKNIGRPVL